MISKGDESLQAMLEMGKAAQRAADRFSVDWVRTHAGP